MPRLSALARNLTAETAFTVLALARALKAQGKDVVELEIGDSPFPSTPHAKAAGIRAIEENQTGLRPEPRPARVPRGRGAVRQRRVRPRRRRPRTSWSPRGRSRSSSFSPRRSSTPATACWSSARTSRPTSPTSSAAARGPSLVPLRAENDFRPAAEDVARFLATDPKPRAIFLNSPHNPTGGVATRDDLAAIADLVRGTDLMVFSDEPYCHMVWEGRHESILAQPGMLDQAVAAYTFSKSYSMSGWRIGFAVAHPEVVEAIGKLINTSASCSPPFVQLAAHGRARARRRRPATSTWAGSAARSSGSGRRAWRGSTGIRVAAAGRDVLRLPRRPRRSATGWGSPRTAWRCTCSKAPTTRSASPAWAASASATPAAASSASVAPSPTSGSTRPSPSCPRPSTASAASGGSSSGTPSSSSTSRSPACDPRTCQGFGAPGMANFVEQDMLG